MGCYAKKGERSQMVGLWEMQKCKNLLSENQNEKNLLIKKSAQYQHFSNFEKIFKILKF